nr:hypothetical protein [Tanacetum cinerariifolium]
MTEQNDYISLTRKNCVSNDNEGRMIERNFVEIHGTFLVKIRDNTMGQLNKTSLSTSINFSKYLDQSKLIAFNDFNYLLKIDKDLFTFDIQGIRTYEEYELNNTVTKDLEEPWLDNRVPYQLCDHICEPYRINNGITKWPTCSSDIDGFCHDRELLGMVRVRSMTYFQNHYCNTQDNQGHEEREDDPTHEPSVDTPYDISNPSGYSVRMCLDVISL